MNAALRLPPMPPAFKLAAQTIYARGHDDIEHIDDIARHLEMGVDSRDVATVMSYIARVLALRPSEAELLELWRYADSDADLHPGRSVDYVLRRVAQRLEARARSDG